MRVGGTGIWSDRESGRVVERDTIMCAHCGRHAFVRPRTASIAGGAVPVTPLTTGRNLPRPTQGALDAHLGGWCGR
ncbi:MAG: hypothetical protein AABY22_02655, partial [Nanoarchaeota archaeon]